jgi:hypothetical protein
MEVAGPANGKSREFREQEQLTHSFEQAKDLSNKRYKGGVTSDLEMLHGVTRYLSSQLAFAKHSFVSFNLSCRFAGCSAEDGRVRARTQPSHSLIM